MRRVVKSFMIIRTINRLWAAKQAALVLFILFISGPLKALDLSHDEALRLRQAGAILPFEKILTLALERYPGAQLLESELEREDDVYVYEMDILTPAGIVRELEFNASTGQFIEDEVGN